MKDLESIARLRVARTALAVARFRLAHGGLPDALAELTPTLLEEVPDDPFDNKPLRYKKLPVGFIVYSVGRDGVDDGGLEKTPSTKSGNPPPDVTFTIER